MKYIYTLIAVLLLSGSALNAQNYVFRYNPYSGMNQEQLELALKQAQKMERSGKVWTALGTGMMVAGSIMTYNGIQDLSFEGSDNYGSFAAGLGILCAGAFPLGYGLIAWLTGNERSNMIEIELLADRDAGLALKPTENGFGLVYAF